LLLSHSHLAQENILPKFVRLQAPILADYGAQVGLFVDYKSSLEEPDFGLWA
jgi:hypothetical protein